MKILQVQTQAEAAGAQRISDMVGEGLRARGHDVRTVFLYRKTDVYDRDPHADFILMHPPRGVLEQMLAVLGLVDHVRKVRPDAVVSFQHYGNIAGTLAARLCGVGAIVANQSGAPQAQGLRGFLTQIDKFMGMAGLYHVNVVNSAWTESQFAAFPAAYRKRLQRIDHGVAAPSRLPAGKRARAVFGLPAGVPLAVSTGRLALSKNHTALVGALAMLPGVHLAIAGAGPERENLLRLATRLNVHNRLHLVGELSPEGIHDFLAAGDVYAFSSTTETFGLAVVEAAIAGLPVVASDLDVLREVLTTDDGRPAALFVPPDADGIAAGLASVFADPALATTLATAGRQLREQYSPSTMCAAYEALFSRNGLRMGTMPSITSSGPERLSV
ncbi:glycosyltransferase family 4 protein [Shinella sedimenti]|uniref:Glycosyltransferase family 4 protein n=3 Tax=Shinella TaxID=323620 RepID=A0ABT0CR33_9HYPH|nr:glycosyltransferase family 4 protein [Shinella sedimenti]MCJ8151046.1 glycosyltransferase family 4 protein [Shinella sedimenti]